MTAAERVVAAIRVWQQEVPGPLVVAIDGHGAAGKTTITATAARSLAAVTIAMDDFFHEAREHADGHPMAAYYDWEALRAQALTPAIVRLRRDDLEQTPSTGSRVILIEGVSSAAPALADLVARTILITTPEPVRLRRLHGRISAAEWDEEWLQAEREYFTTRPPEAFDLVVSGGADPGYEPTIGD